MTNEETLKGKELSRKNKAFRIILLVSSIFILFELYIILLDYGASFLLALFIVVFIFLFILGFLVKSNIKSFFSRFKSKKNESLTEDVLKKKEEFLKEYQKYHPQLRRVDYINLNLKYRKPIIRKCNNCGIILASFVKKCPNCGVKVTD